MEVTRWQVHLESLREGVREGGGVDGHKALSKVGHLQHPAHLFHGLLLHLVLDLPLPNTGAPGRAGHDPAEDLHHQAQAVALGENLVLQILFCDLLLLMFGKSYTLKKSKESGNDKTSSPLPLPAPDLISTGLLRPSQGQAAATSAGQGGLWAGGWLALPGGGSVIS